MKETNKEVQFIKQPDTNLCWATCILMIRNVSKKANPDITPEKIVHDFLYGGGSQDNNIAGYDGVITSALEHYAWGVNSVKYMKSSLEWKDIKKSVDSDCPVLVGYGWKQGGGHVMVIGGYEEKGEDWGLVKLFDPLKDAASVISFDRLLKGDYDPEVKTGMVGHVWDCTWIKK